MREKKSKIVKKKSPLPKGIRWMMEFTQHICACVIVFCLIAIVIKSSVYIEDYGYRSWIIGNGTEDEQIVSNFFSGRLSNETLSVIRFVTIRSQLETGGDFDLKREINISDYYYRKNIQSYSDNGQRKYFPDAVYYLEDLIRWQQSGGLRFLNQSFTYNQTNNLINAVALKEADAVESKVNLVDNMFLTVANKRLEALVTNDKDYSILCEQLAACMLDLSNNYNEYQRYMKYYAEGKTNFVYYIYMDNKAGDIYTNNPNLNGLAKSKIQEYFSNLVCSAAGTTALNPDIHGDYTLSLEEVGMYMSDYDYAFGDNAVVYTGIDLGIDAEDGYYSTLYNAVLNYDVEQVYLYVGIAALCGIYYLFVTVYLMCAAGRRVDREGTEYIELKWTDSIVLEIFLMWCAALGFVILGLGAILGKYFLISSLNYIDKISALIVMLTTFICSIFFVETVCSLARRYKSGTLFKNSLIYKFGITQIVRLCKGLKGKCGMIKQKTQYYMERSGLWERTWGIMLVEVVFYLVCLAFIIVFAANRDEDMAFYVSALMLAVLLYTSYRRMHRKIEREHIVEKIEGIVAGEGSRVDEDSLSLENAALGRAVNEIGEGIQTAVEKSIKDERLKAELLTNVSHDIKTPLTSIINYVDLLKKEPMESQKALEYIDVLEKKSLKLKNLIQDLIEVSKISTGNIEYEMMPLNLHELIMQTAAEYDDKFAEHCLKTVYNNYAKESYILADSRRMCRVMENIMSNVYKYALEGTRVYLEVNQVGNELVFTTKNISAKELDIDAEELTERFVRGDLSRTTEGSGLGLAIAQNLIIGQGGDFRIILDGDLFKVQITFPIYKK